MKTLVFVVLLAWSTAALAYCTWHTINLPDGRTMRCTTCCYAGQCTTNCN